MIVFGVYLAIVGLSLVFVPETVLRLLGLRGIDLLVPLTPEATVWVRLAGVLTVALAYYFVAAGRDRATWFMRTSITVRLFFPASLVALVAFGYAPPVLLLFAGPDLAGAAWTAYALRVPRGASAE